MCLTHLHRRIVGVQDVRIDGRSGGRCRCRSPPNGRIDPAGLHGQLGGLEPLVEGCRRQPIDGHVEQHAPAEQADQDAGARYLVGRLRLSFVQKLWK